MGLREGTTLTIANTETESEVLSLQDVHIQGPVAICFFPPATLTGTVKVHVAKSPSDTFSILQDGGQDLTLAAGKATQILCLTVGAIKLVSSVAEDADRVFGVKGHGLL